MHMKILQEHNKSHLNHNYIKQLTQIITIIIFNTNNRKTSSHIILLIHQMSSNSYSKYFKYQMKVLNYNLSP